jgi:nucleoside-triphosphatase THEP1
VGLNSIQSCIILDEPEIGRSEHWVNKISERILETLDELASPVFGNIHETSLTIVSHRESLLRSLSRTNNYFVMQPLMNRDNLIIDFGEEE